MREKLIELLYQIEADRGYVCDGCCKIPMDEVVGYIADHLIANGVTIQKWIPVTERLPEVHIEDYEEPDGSRMQFEVSEDQWIITASGCQTKARYETGVVYQGWVGDYGQGIRDITHWMPLPEPPKEE